MRARVAVLVSLVAVVVAVTPASASNNRGYRGFGYCGVVGGLPARECGNNNLYGSVFIAKRQDFVRYRLCVLDTRRDRKRCFARSTRRAGTKSVIYLQNKGVPGGRPGLYVLRFQVGGRNVGRARLRILAGGD